MKKALLIIFTLFSFITYAQDIIMENGNVTGCSGTFFDSGGAGGTYSSNENLVLTICPDNPGQLVSLNFTEFNKYNSSYHWMPAKENTLYIFPSWLKHKVEPNMNNDERISISFNTIST